MSFNSGYDYEAFVQYDDYGAVVQVEQESNIDDACKYKFQIFSIFLY
jgi:hypothetical protein